MGSTGERGKNAGPGKDCPRPVAPPGSRGSFRLVLLIIALATAGVFASALSGGFVWVDHKEIVQEAFVIRSWDDFRTAWTGPVTDMGRDGGARSSGYYRPVQLLLVTLDVALFGQNAALHHIPNILLHIAGTLLLALLVLRLTGDRMTAGLCGLLFGVHPVHVESVTWVAGSKDVLAGFFFFAALYLYVKWSGVGAAAQIVPRRGRPWVLAAAVALFVLGLLSKEAVIVLPAVCVLVEAFFGARGGGLRGGDGLRRWAGAGAFAAAAAAYIAARAALLGSVGDMEGWHGEGPLQTFLTMPGVLAEYVGKLIVPLGLTTADTTRIVTSAADPVFLAGAFVVTALAAAAFLGRRMHPTAALGIAWFFAALLPVSNVLPVHHIKAERFLYLPSAGFLLAAAGVWTRLARHGEGNRLQSRGRAVLAAAAAYAIFLGAVTIDRNRDWRDDITLFSADVAGTPNYREGHAMLGFAELQRGRNEAALSHLEAAAREDPRFTSFVNRLGLFDNTGRALMGLGRPAAALEAFGRAAALDPGEPLVFMHMGVAQGALGRIEEALESYARSESLDPENPLLYFNRALTLYRAGRLDESLADLDRAAGLDPGHAGTLNLKGTILLGRGEREGAARCFRRSLRIRPGQPAIEELLREAEGAGR